MSKLQQKKTFVVGKKNIDDKLKENSTNGGVLPTAIQGMQNKCVALTVYMIGQYHNSFYQLTEYKKILKISDMNSNRKFSRVIIFVSSYILSSFYQVRYINMYIH